MKSELIEFSEWKDEIYNALSKVLDMNYWSMITAFYSIKQIEGLTRGEISLILSDRSSMIIMARHSETMELKMFRICDLCPRLFEPKPKAKLFKLFGK